MRRSLILTAIALSPSARACMWDTDTLAEEATYGRNFVTTIAGRFPHNPPLYYAMRRDRLLAKKVKAPSDYDDLAVAYEKLGDSLSALKWIDRKPKGTLEDEYRRLANRGTFLVHAWLGHRLDASAGRRGLNDLKAAVRLNADAHFGREQVQIKLVGYLLNPPEGFEADRDPLKAAEGYAGIVRLGSGWESPDVFRMMAINLASPDLRPRPLGAVASLALLRAKELVAAGHKARLDDGYGFKMVEGAQTPSLMAETEAEFKRLRQEADKWSASRTAFMTARLNAGRHPDTDPSFWQGWTDGPPPEIRHHWITETFGVTLPWYFVAIGFTIVVAVAAAILFVFYFVFRTIFRGFRTFRRRI